MVDVLEIKNFKSIKHLKLDCKRVNVFIGRPNTGKSNILESLGLLSFLYYARQGYEARDFVRFESTGNLFYDEDLGERVQIDCDSISLPLKFDDGTFAARCEGPGGTNIGELVGTHSSITASPPGKPPLDMFRSYRFAVKAQFEKRESGSLLPPIGDNLVSLLMSHKELRSLVNDLFAPMGLRLGLRLGLRPQESKIEIIKQFEDVIVSYPYHMTSETMQRLVFHLAAIITNKESILIFEEPEAHAFPYYIKYLAEEIALDENDNQYFISTHSPYFLEPLLEKTKAKEIAIFLTYYEDYQTKVKALTDEQIRDAMEMEVDVFFNVDRFLEDE